MRFKWKDIWEIIKQLIDKKITTTTTTLPDLDDLDITSIKWLGADYSNAVIDTIIHNAEIDDKWVYTNYEPYNWKIGGGAVKVDAICCLFYEQGNKVVGGKYDWWRVGGQGQKMVDNVHHGYQGHSFPSRDKEVYTCIVSIDGKLRSNIKLTTWK